MEFVCFREKSQEVEVTVYTVICLPNINVLMFGPQMCIQLKSHRSQAELSNKRIMRHRGNAS